MALLYGDAHDGQALSTHKHTSPRPFLAPPTAGHGAFHWDQNTSLLAVKLTGGRSLEVRTENAIDISQTLAITVDQFYAIQRYFYLKVATLLGIAPERFRVVKIVPGSTILQMQIVQDFRISAQVGAAGWGLEAVQWPETSRRAG